MNFFPRRAAAEYLRNKGLPITAATLATLATRGGGPPFAIYNGRAIYRQDALNAWADASLDLAFSTATERRTAIRATAVQAGAA